MPSEHSSADALHELNLGPVADRVMASLCGQVSRERVDRLLVDLLEQEFSEARVTLFLPILLQRLACETLRHELAQAPAPRPGGH